MFDCFNNKIENIITDEFNNTTKKGTISTKSFPTNC